jgi:heavy metal sensor kinase
MALSLRARLTVWYTVLLLVSVAVLSGAVLLLDWHLLLKQADESLDTLSLAAVNVIHDELAEHDDLSAAAREMEAVVQRRQFVVEVFDGRGAVVNAIDAPLVVPDDLLAAARPRLAATISGTGGRRWRVSLHAGRDASRPYVVGVAAPIEELEEQWHTLLTACLVGIPLVLALAAAGGWWLGRAGLRPLSAMALQAREITANTLDSRLSIPDAGAELGQLAESFNSVLGRLGTALATQRRFMADASHELRTPVSIVRTAADVTLGRPERDEVEYREALAAISDQSARLARLVDDMLVLARADAGGYPMQTSRVDLSALVRGGVRDLMPRAEGKLIALTVAADAAPVNGDATLLRRLFENLLSNAIAYTPRHGSVAVSVARADGHVLLRVRDSGPGIPVDERERIFERFVRLDPARESGGAGLGLSIARWVAEAHGGDLRVESSGPGGTVFTATLPVDRCPMTDVRCPMSDDR